MGHIHLQATEISNTAKLQYYTDDTKTTFTVESGVRMVHNDVIDIFQQRLLIDQRTLDKDGIPRRT